MSTLSEPESDYSKVDRPTIEEYLENGDHKRMNITELARRHRRPLLGLLGLILILGAWQICGVYGIVNPVYTSYPSQIAIALKRYLDGGGGLYAVQVSAIEFGIGLGLSLTVGLLAGMAIGWWSWLDELFDPLINAGQAMPLIALVPLLVIWFGIGTESKVAVVFLASIFPILINTISGVKTTDKQLVMVAQSFKATRLQIFRTVVVPGATPSIVTGIRLGIGLGMIGMVVGQLIASTAGIGYTMELAGENLQTSTMFAALFLVSIAAVILMQGVRYVERRVERWRPRVGN